MLPKTSKKASTAVYRKMLPPWYDSEIACLVLIGLMLGCFWFGCIGWQLACEQPDPSPHRVMPLILIVLSSLVILSATIRLIRRFLER